MLSIYVQLVEESDDDEAVPIAQLIAGDDPLGDCTRNEANRLVRQAVLALPARYREVIVLCDFQELSYAEAALALDCPAGTVNSSDEVEVVTQFFLLRDGEDLSSIESLSLVRVELPGSAIKEAGIPIVLELANTRVTADVILAQDGLARAIRFVANSSATESIKRDYGTN
jgi:hypothetical protein